MSEKEKESQENTEPEAVASESKDEAGASADADVEVPEAIAEGKDSEVEVEVEASVTADAEIPESSDEGTEATADAEIPESSDEAGTSAEADVEVPETLVDGSDDSKETIEEPLVTEEAEAAAEETVEAAEAVEAEKTEEAGEAAAVEEALESAKALKAEETKKPAKGRKKTKKPAVVEVADEVDPETPVDTGPPKRWYVVHTYSGHENKVKENIKKMINVSQVQDHFGQIIVPTEEVAEMKKGKKTVTTKKFFPSYILVEMNMSDEARHLVSDIPGVTSFVGSASGPQALSVPEVERILGRMDKKKQTVIPEIPFTLGEHIRIKDGPFSDFTGIIDEINAERGKLKVLVSIFGRETPVELDFLQVENL